MIVDIHTHVFPDALAARTIAVLTEKANGAAHAATDGTLDGLKRSMAQSGVDISVVQPVVTRPSQFDSVNRFAAAINGKDGIYSFGGIHPDDDAPAAHLRDIRALGLRGVKLHPDYQGVMVDDERNLRLLDGALQNDLFVLLHAGLDVGYPEKIHCPPDAARRTIERLYGDSRKNAQPRLIFAHLGGYTQLDDVERYLVGEPIYLDVSFILDKVDPERLVSLIRAHGTDKILFGTDCPWGNQADFVARMNALPLTEAERAAVFAESAKKILGI